MNVFHGLNIRSQTRIYRKTVELGSEFRFQLERLESRQMLSASISGIVYNGPGNAVAAGVQVYLDLRGIDMPEVGDPLQLQTPTDDIHLIN